MQRYNMQSFLRCVTMGGLYISHKESFSLSLLFPSFLCAVEKGHILLSGQSKGKMALQQMHHAGSLPSPRNM